jgi:hypothetical protein
MIFGFMNLFQWHILKTVVTTIACHMTLDFDIFCRCLLHVLPVEDSCPVLGEYLRIRRDLDVVVCCRCWQYRQLTKVHRCPRSTRPDKARRLGYKAKQGESYFLILNHLYDLYMFRFV